jgi:hypothetical protein
VGALPACDLHSPTIWIASPEYLCSPRSGYVAETGDCAFEDATRWRTATNLLVDRDGDGFTVPEAGSICIGNQLPRPYVSAANGNDCDDAK